MSALINHYSPCQIKFAFDVSEDSPLAWHEYFGFEDTFDMIKHYCKLYLISDTVSFKGTDGSGAKSTIIFETVCEPSDFNADYALVCDILKKISDKPLFNDNKDVFDNMIETLEDDHDLSFFEAYNLAEHGFKFYKDALANIKIERKNREEKRNNVTA